MQSELPTAGVGGTDQCVHCPAVDGLFDTHTVWQRIRLVVLKECPLAMRRGRESEVVPVLG